MSAQFPRTSSDTTITFSSSRLDVTKVLQRSWKLLLGLIIPLALLPLALSSDKETRCGYVLVLMAMYWMFEPIPIAATALIPVALFPLLDIMSTNDTSTSYMKATNMMFFGGLMMAIAVENCQLHKRIALKVLLFVGTSIRRIMLGIMLTTMFLSMWISNTASTAMMIPIVEAMVDEIKTCRTEFSDNTDIHHKTAIFVTPTSTSTSTLAQNDEKKEDTTKNWTQCPTLIRTVRQTLLLSVAYAANIGGTGTLTGTGTNLILQGLIEDMYPKSSEITFSSFFYYAAPGMVICVVLAWLLLHFMFLRNRVNTSKDQEQAVRSMIAKKYDELGAPSFHEKAVGSLFLVVVLLWLTRSPKFITGWAQLLPEHAGVKDATPVILIAILMFLLPARPQELLSGNGKKKMTTLLDWKTVQKKTPWGVIFLLGGGLALAEGTKKSGLSMWLGNELATLNTYSPRQAMCLLTILAAFLTEVTSNVATASVILPVINQIAIAMHVNPLLLMLPVTISVSFAFMLPVATPPNALVFEALDMKPIDMIKPGFVMNVLCIIIQLILVNSWGVFIFDLNHFPEWAGTMTLNQANSTIPAF